MTAEPVREPEKDHEAVPEEPGVPPREEEPIEARDGHDAQDAQDAEMPPDAAAAAESAGSMTAAEESSTVATAPSDVAAPAVDAPVPSADEAATTPARPSRWPVALAAARRMVAFLLAVALFAGGVLLGATTFQRNRPASASDAIVFSEPPAAVTQAFVLALAANDPDAIRSSLSENPNKDLINEFKKFDIKSIKAVDTLGTSVDGTRSATEILLHAEDSAGGPFEVNLVVLVDGDQIEGFR